MSKKHMVRRWFRFGTRTYFLPVPMGDKWIMKTSNGEVGTFSGDKKDTLITSGMDWHHVDDIVIVSAFLGMESWTPHQLRS